MPHEATWCMMFACEMISSAVCTKFHAHIFVLHCTYHMKYVFTSRTCLLPVINAFTCCDIHLLLVINVLTCTPSHNVFTCSDECVYSPYKMCSHAAKYRFTPSDRNVHSQRQQHLLPVKNAFSCRNKYACVIP